MNGDGSAPAAATLGIPAASSSSAPLRFKVAEADSMQPITLVAVFVLVMAVLAAWLVKRYGGSRWRAPAPKGRMALQETLWVAPKIRVSRLNCEGRTLLLASSPQGLAWLDLGSLPPAPEQDHG